MENCGRCGRSISDAESVYVYRDRPVCRKCYEGLRPTEAMPGVASASNTSPATFGEMPATTEPPRIPGYKALGFLASAAVIVGILESALGLGVMFMGLVHQTIPSAGIRSTPSQIRDAVTLLAAGFVTWAGGEAARAFRDIAINSWHIRQKP